VKHFAKPLLVSAALSAATLLPAYAEMDVAGLSAAIEASVEADYPKLDALYKELHAHPELAFEEVKTAARLAAEMRALGFEVLQIFVPAGSFSTDIMLRHSDNFAVAGEYALGRPIRKVDVLSAG
jgi:hypothetical protein